jgi:hypothetical protein
VARQEGGAIRVNGHEHYAKGEEILTRVEGMTGGTPAERQLLVNIASAHFLAAAAAPRLTGRYGDPVAELEQREAGR